MATEKRLIDANALGICKAKREVFDNPAYADGWNIAIAIIDNAPTVDAVPAEQFNALKSLAKGEWVECKLVQETLGIDFATGLKMFDFSRTAEWNPDPLNGQKITTKFRLKNAVEVVRCKDCKHCEVTPDGLRGHGRTQYICRLHKGLVVVNTDTFCSYGERKCNGC